MDNYFSLEVKPQKANNEQKNNKDGFLMLLGKTVLIISMVFNVGNMYYVKFSFVFLGVFVVLKLQILQKLVDFQEKQQEQIKQLKKYIDSYIQVGILTVFCLGVCTFQLYDVTTFRDILGVQTFIVFSILLIEWPIYYAVYYSIQNNQKNELINHNFIQKKGSQQYQLDHITRAKKIMGYDAKQQQKEMETYSIEITNIQQDKQQ